MTALDQANRILDTRDSVRMLDLADAGVKLAEEVIAEGIGSGWISVDDRLPEESDRLPFRGCLVVRPSGYIDMESAHPSWWNKANATSRIESPVVYWCELPSPPKDIP